MILPIATLAAAFAGCCLLLWRRRKGYLLLYPVSVLAGYFLAYHQNMAHAASNALLLCGILYLNIGLYQFAKARGMLPKLAPALRRWFAVEEKQGADFVPRKNPAPPPVPERVPRLLPAALLLLAASAFMALIA